MLVRKTTGLVSLVVLTLVISACNLFGSPSESIPPGKSDVLGVIRYIDDFTGEGLNVELAGETVTAGEGGVFAFTDVENDRYVLNVYRNDHLVYERDLVVAEDIADLTVEIGENLFVNSGFEEHIDEPISSDHLRIGWSANRSLDTEPGAKPLDVTVDNAVARTGTRSLKMHGELVDDKSPRGTIRQYGNDLVAGATYRLTGYFKMDPEVSNLAIEPARLRLRYYLAEGGTLSPLLGDDGDFVVVPDDRFYAYGGQFLNVYPESYDDEWNRLYVEFKMPEKTNRFLAELYFNGFWGEEDEATLWWDDITLIRLD